MKLPRTILQWEKLTSAELDELDEASGIAINLMSLAGISSPHEHDAVGAELGDDVQSALMDTVLRSPQMKRLFQDFLNESKLPDPECVSPEASKL